ncbi:MAG: DUF3999 domain-containing protein [Alcanivorax sp.]|nr:DUF3999 domain-containing protein [Alcanivorax sp.]
MRLWILPCFIAALGYGSATLAAPLPDDFAEGIPITPVGEGRAYQLSLPEPVYQVSTRADLGDVRVFNRDGGVVQHAFCEIEDQTKQNTVAHPAALYGLPPGRRPAEHLGGQLAIDTADGLSMRWQRSEPEEGASAEAGAFEYIVDARGVEQAISGIRLDWRWRSPEGRQELPIRIAASDDLDQWRTVVTRTTLLRLDGEALETVAVVLPEHRYRFLRLIPEDERARDWLHGAQILTTRTEVESVPLIWAETERSAGDALDGRFQSSRPAPARQWRLTLPGPNRVLRVRLSSRADDTAAWRERYLGSVASAAGSGETEARTMTPTTDPLWRVQVLSGGESLAGEPVSLHLGYPPLQLGFLAQGEGPFLLAYGSRRVPPAQVLDCDALGSEPAPARAELEQLRELGGKAVLQPLPEPIPARRIVLWGVLILGAVLVVIMAVGLLRKLDNR